MSYSKVITGAAGEHLVMSRLLKRGYIAALAPDKSDLIDIIATTNDLSAQFTIQVKTRAAGPKNRHWVMSVKNEKEFANLFYCFVELGENVEETERVYVVPSNVVAPLLKRAYCAWLTLPGRNGQRRNPTRMRQMDKDFSAVLPDDTKFHKGWLEKYKENWDILPSASPVLG